MRFRISPLYAQNNQEMFLIHFNGNCVFEKPKCFLRKTFLDQCIVDVGTWLRLGDNNNDKGSLKIDRLIVFLRVMASSSIDKVFLRVNTRGDKEKHLFSLSFIVTQKNQAKRIRNSVSLISFSSENALFDSIYNVSIRKRKRI